MKKITNQNTQMYCRFSRQDERTGRKSRSSHQQNHTVSRTVHEQNLTASRTVHMGKILLLSRTVHITITLAFLRFTNAIRSFTTLLRTFVQAHPTDGFCCKKATISHFLGNPEQTVVIHFWK